MACDVGGKPMNTIWFRCQQDVLAVIVPSFLMGAILHYNITASLKGSCGKALRDKGTAERAATIKDRCSSQGATVTATANAFYPQLHKPWDLREGHQAEVLLWVGCCKAWQKTCVKASASAILNKR